MVLLKLAFPFIFLQGMFRRLQAILKEKYKIYTECKVRDFYGMLQSCRRQYRYSRSAKHSSLLLLMKDPQFPEDPPIERHSV
jgi:hypothetical protein